QPINPYVYEILYSKWDLFYTEIDPEMRNESLALFKNFIDRIRDSSYALKRDTNKLIKVDELKFESEINSNLEKLENGEKFLKEAVKVLLLNLKPGSSYQKKSFAYKLLLVLIQSGLDSRVDSKYHDKHKRINYPFHVEIYNEILVRLLIDNISDDFEDIRFNSANILSMSPITVDKFVNLELVSERCMLLLNDMKGRSIDSGARFFQFLFSYYQSNQQLDVCLKIIDNLLKKLDLGIDFAQKDLATASYKENIHGYFASLKFIFEIMDITLFPNISPIITKVIQQAKNAWLTVKSVLQDESPEGNVPEDVEFNYSSTIELMYGKPTQVISSYSWRSLKESTHLLKILLDRFPLPQSTIISIGETISEQLATVRHKGAFSSVYPTFVSCCKRCQRTDELSHIPEKWLQQNISLVESKSQSITRRSAGLPFLITAILTSDPTLLPDTLEQLIKVASTPLSDSQIISNIDLSQVNAFNSIKAIFTDSSLSSFSVNHVDEALTLSLNKFGSPVWAIRNCAMMLFAALQNRIFGTKVTRIDGVNSTISARLFFTKYKSMKNVLYQSLTDVITKGENIYEIDKIFPVLTVLSRLEAVSDIDGLNDFKPLVIEFLGSKLWKVREMAARSLPGLITNESLVDECTQFLTQVAIVGSSSNDLNRVHGNLLALKELMMRLKIRENSNNNDVSSKLESIILSYLNHVLNIDSYAIKLTYFQLLRIIQTGLEENDINKLGNWFIENNSIGSKLDGSKQLALKECNVILLNYYKDQHDASNLKDVIELGMYSSLFEVQLSTIEFCNCEVQSLNNEIKVMLVDCIWRLIELDCWEYLKLNALTLLKNLIVSKVVIDYSTDELISKLRILTEFMETDGGNQDMILSSLESMGSLIGSFNNIQTEDSSIFDNWLQKIHEFSFDDLEFTDRIASLRSVIAFNEIYECLDLKRFKVLIILYNFLSDDDDSIRWLASSHLCKFLKLEFVLIPIEVEKKMLSYLATELTRYDNCLDLIFDSKYLFNFETRSFSSLFIQDHSLFTTEKQNFYLDEISQTYNFNQLVISTYTSIDSKSLLQPGTMKLFNLISKRLLEIISTLQTLNEKDGCFGYTMNPEKFSYIYNTLQSSITLYKLGYQTEL
ncbi:hypothetical protein CANARDRAFT_188333, partial [[Candida] arabinofermentans NRRL YB-2248]